jgi:hypothetical protein
MCRAFRGAGLVMLFAIAAPAGRAVESPDSQTWWSLRPVARPELPAVRDATWSDEPVDRFVRACLEARGLSPARPADRGTLLRRLSFVLTGLPPAPDAVDAFVRDLDPDAYAKLVDRLLASPHFGEHWARHWMDVVRYGDTYGYEWDIPAKGAWRYRDYLIRAFNQDIPFDQLVREQIAGDLLSQPRVDPMAQIDESLVGPMFFQMGEKRHGDSAEFNGIHQEMLHNKIDAFSKAFLGLTVGCARCHDHKLDPIPQRDYYALAGVFMSSRWVARTLDRPARNRAVLERLRAMKPAIRAALADQWLDEMRSLATCLVAAQGNLAGAGDRVAAWNKVLTRPAGQDRPLEDPLAPWSQVVQAVRAGKPPANAWRQIAGQYETTGRARTQDNASRFRLAADFRQNVPPGWSVEGVGLRDGPVCCGDFTVALDGPAAIGMLLPGGLFTNALSPRLNGAVRSPYLHTLPGAHLTFESAGGDFAAHRTVIDNAFLCEKQTYLTEPQPAWLKFSTFPAMSQRRIYIELATKASNPNFPPR